MITVGFSRAFAVTPDKSLYQSLPFMSAYRAVPHVLLVLSKDMKMFQQAYDELHDMDGDGRIDTGFNPKVNYYGYFDSLSCYRYEGRSKMREGDRNGYFVRSGPTIPDDSQSTLDSIRTAGLGTDLVPAARAASGICQHSHTSESGDFSGNWLNYLTTSRMDVIRKILYGGFRYKDTPAETILEPSYVPRDANSWGTDVLADNRWFKETPMTSYYDISKFTPFPKPQAGKAHFFARVRNTYGGGTYQVFEYILNADKKSFLGSTEITGANGRYFDWVLQDGPNPSHNRLSYADYIIKTYGLKVKVCDQGNVGAGEDCRVYPKGNLKPVGLLQKTGENGDIYFGLLSGSYDEVTRIQGGVLRNHIDHLNKSVDIENYGQIKKDGLIWALDSFRIAGGVEHNGLEAYSNSVSWGNPTGEMLFEGVRYMARMAAPGSRGLQPTPMFLPKNEYNYNKERKTGFYRDWNNLPVLAGGDCAKPIILLISEADSDSDGDSQVNGPNDLNMKPLGSIYPGEAKHLPNFNMSAYLRRLTDLEGLNRGQEFFYSRGRTDDCTPKTLNSLMDVEGMCPYRPSYQGTYSSAAVAYFAHTHNFGRGERDLGLDIYTVTMSPVFPSLDFPLKKDNGHVTGGITILPASMSDSSKKNSKGRILSFLNYYILEWWADKNGTPYHVKIKVNYEDSAQGYNPDFGLWPRSDWDMDVMIEHTIDLVTKTSPQRASNGFNFAGDKRASGILKLRGGTYYPFREQGTSPFAIKQEEVAGLTIRSWKVNNSTNQRMSLGYSISGSTRDGTYMDLGHCSGIDSYATPPTCNWPKGYGKNVTSDDGTFCKKAFGECTPLFRGDPPSLAVTRTFEFSSSGSEGEKLPGTLFLAAKYGGFQDLNNNGRPDKGEWEGSDGNPKNYFNPVNVTELPSKLEAAFKDIAQSVATGTATSVSVSSVLGGGLSLQTAFYPKYKSPGTGQTVSWVGTVYGLFVDRFGNFREDSNRNHRLELKSSNGTGNGDYAVTFNSVRTPPQNKPKCYVPGAAISRCYDEKGDGELKPLDGPAKSPANVHRLKPVWDAGRWLAELKDPSKRNIYYVDPDKKDQILPFIDEPATVRKLTGHMIYDNYLDILPPGSSGSKPSRTETASMLVRYIQGQDFPQWRPRTTGNPWTDNITPVVWRLGDIINSKPILVGQPAFGYEHLYRDLSYASYKTAQARRRQVVYFGTNDGFLHAVNAGYFGTMASGEVLYEPGGRDLGEELWALIPSSVLPHLQWLADPGYIHSYYVDLKPVVADIKINGQWRTILICGLRLGGRPIEAAGSSASHVKNIYSEVMALDVTDPNSPPKLLWSFGAEELGLMVGLPAVVTSGGRWYTVLASGPAMDFKEKGTGRINFGNFSPYDGFSAQKARLIILDAANGRVVSGLSNPNLTVKEDLSFFNDPYIPLPLKRELNGVWHDEAVYYGMTVSRDSQGLDKGAVYRLQMVDAGGSPLPADQWKLRRLASVDRPVTGAVNSAKDFSGNLWVVFGTGRMWGLDDIITCGKKASPQCLENHQHYLFGVKEELADGRMTFAERNVNDLVDVSGAEVYGSGQVVKLKPIAGLALGTGGTMTYDALARHLRGPAVGYKRRLNLSELLANEKDSQEMVITQPQITRTGADKSVVSFTSYEPTAQTCGDFGRGFMYVADTFTGLGAPHMALLFPAQSGAAGPGLVAGGISTGYGQPAGAVIISVDGKAIIRASTSENSFYDVEVPTDNKQLNTVISWREVLNSGFELPKAIMSDGLNLTP
jgi:type IV pilus assembly protein PilY1